MTTHVDYEPRILGTRCGGADTQAQISTETAQQLSEVLPLLGHPVQMQILEAKDDCCGTDTTSCACEAADVTV